MKKETKNNSGKQLKLRELILPNKKINFFISTVLLLGIISGAIFLMMSNETDKTSVMNQIKTFFQNISNSAIDDGLAFKNSLIINYIFVFSIWIFGLSIFGILINIFLTYIKGFLVGFSIASIFFTYRTKGILAALLYSILGQLLNIIVVIILAIYSIMFTSNLLKIITSKSGNNRFMLKKYIVILMMCIILSFISSLLEAYVLPVILKFIVSFYI